MQRDWHRWSEIRTPGFGGEARGGDVAARVAGRGVDGMEDVAMAEG